MEKIIKHCLYTNWSSQYKKLSFKTEFLELTAKEVDFILTNFDNNLLGRMKKCLIGRTLIIKISEKLKLFENGAFIKLETRSPKNNYHAETINYMRGITELLKY